MSYLIVPSHMLTNIEQLHLFFAGNSSKHVPGEIVITFPLLNLTQCVPYASFVNVVRCLAWRGIFNYV